MAITVIKYILDNRMESRKTALSLAAKRRGHFIDKQAAAIAGMYERFARCELAIERCVTTKPGPSSPETAEARSEEEIGKVKGAYEDLEEYHLANEVYFLEPMAENMRSSVNIIKSSSMMLFIERHGENRESLGEEGIESLQKSRDTIRKYLAGLRTRFAKLMLQDDPTLFELARKESKGFPPTVKAAWDRLLCFVRYRRDSPPSRTTLSP